MFRHSMPHIRDRIEFIHIGACFHQAHVIRNVYNMSGRVVSDIQTRAEGESLYIRYNTDANHLMSSLGRLIL
jgi:hypothetical protein